LTTTNKLERKKEMKISSSYRTELAIAVNELSGQALLNRLESIVRDASEVAYKQALELKQLLDGAGE